MRKGSAPDTLALELTYSCNLRCAHCIVSAGKPLPQELSTGEWKEVIDQADEMGVFQVALTGGEPTLRRDFVEIVRYINRSMDVSVATNGLLKDPLLEVVQEVVYFQISLDGGEEFHDKNRRVKGAWRRALETAEALEKEGAHVVINTTFWKENIREFDKVLKIIREHGFDWKVSLLIPMGRGEKREMLSPEEVVQLLKRVREIESEVNVSFGDSLGPFMEGWEGCGAGKTMMAVDPEGYVIPCTELHIRVGHYTEGLRKLWERIPEYSCSCGSRPACPAFCLSVGKYPYCPEG